MMKANGRSDILKSITDLTKSFPGYGGWSIDSYIEDINNMKGNYSIAMPPEATMAYMETAWSLKPVLEPNIAAIPNFSPNGYIEGLTRPNGPVNRWDNLAHYVYRDSNGRYYSWGKQFISLEDLNRSQGKNYSIVCRIKV